MTRARLWFGVVTLTLFTLNACDSSVDTDIGGPPVVSTTPTAAPQTSVVTPPTTVPPATVPPATVPPATVPPATVPLTTVPPTMVPPTTAPPTTAPPTTVPVPDVLERDDEGDGVIDLQRRLVELHFWLGSVDGEYGMLTEQAVYAFQKAKAITIDGRVGPQTRAALADPRPPSLQSGQGRVIEIDKARQLIYAVDGGTLSWVFNTSTGTELPYAHPGGYTALADTPPGTHNVFAETDGWEEGRLGPLYRPKYFHIDGIAVHGYGSVPPYPASHGCARVSFAAIDFIWDRGLMPMGSTVLVYGEAPAVE